MKLLLKLVANFTVQVMTVVALGLALATYLFSDWLGIVLSVVCYVVICVGYAIAYVRLESMAYPTTGEESTGRGFEVKVVEEEGASSKRSDGRGIGDK